jgi:hypothetical protein
MALAALFEKKSVNDDSNFKIPINQRFVDVIYDVTSALKPYINNTLKFFQVNLKYY